MAQRYLQIPFSFENLINKKKQANRIAIEDSIRQNIQFLILSHIGDLSYDKSVGFEMWDYDKLVFYHEKEPYYVSDKPEYRGLLENQQAKKNFNNNLKALIVKHELRLQNISTEFNFEKIHGNLSVYQRFINLKVEGILKSTGLPLSPPFSLKIIFTPFSVVTNE